MIIFVIIVIGTNQLLTSANPSCFVIDDQDVPISLPPHPELPGDPPIVSQPRSILPGYVYEYDDSLDLSPFEPDQRFCHSPQWPYAPDSSVYNHFYDFVLPELELALEMRPRSFSPPPKTQTQVLLPPSHLVPADLDTAIFRSPKSSPTWTPDSQPSNFDQSSSPYLDLRSKQTRIDEDVTRILQIVKDVTAEDSGRFQKVSPSSSPVASTIPRKHSTQEGDAFYDAASEIESVATESDSTRAESNPNNSKDAAPNVDIQNVVAVLESSAKAERNMTIWPEAEILATRVNNSTESDVIGRVRRQSQSPPKAVLHSDDRANVVPGHGKVRFQIPHPAEAHVYTDQSDGSDSEEPVSPNRLDDDESDDSYLSSPDSSSSPTNPPVYSTIPSSPRGPVLNRSVGGRTQENLLSASTTEKQAQPKSRKLLIKFKDAILGKKQRNRL